MISLNWSSFVCLSSFSFCHPFFFSFSPSANCIFFLFVLCLFFSFCMSDFFFLFVSLFYFMYACFFIVSVFYLLSFVFLSFCLIVFFLFDFLSFVFFYFVILSYAFFLWSFFSFVLFLLIFHDMKKRNTEKFLVNHVNTERYMKSAIPAMQRALNKDELKLRKLLVDNLVPREHCLYEPISVKI